MYLDVGIGEDSEVWSQCLPVTTERISISCVTPVYSLTKWSVCPGAVHRLPGKQRAAPCEGDRGEQERLYCIR